MFVVISFVSYSIIVGSTYLGDLQFVRPLFLLAVISLCTCFIIIVVRVLFLYVCTPFVFSLQRQVFRFVYLVSVQLFSSLYLLPSLIIYGWIYVFRSFCLSVCRFSISLVSYVFSYVCVIYLCRQFVMSAVIRYVILSLCLYLVRSLGMELFICFVHSLLCSWVISDFLPLFRQFVLSLFRSFVRSLVRSLVSYLCLAVFLYVGISLLLYIYIYIYIYQFRYLVSSLVISRGLSVLVCYVFMHLVRHVFPFVVRCC